MESWVNKRVAQSIIEICQHISNDDFLELERKGFFEVASANDIRRSILEYLDGDNPNP